jgi:hypothetical protein
MTVFMHTHNHMPLDYIMPRSAYRTHARTGHDAAIRIA